MSSLKVWLDLLTVKRLDARWWPWNWPFTGDSPWWGFANGAVQAAAALVLI